MKQIFVILIGLSLLLQTNSKFVILADFYMHRDYIAKNLCENRNNPEKKCLGSCCLKKKLASDEKDQSPSSGSQRGKEEVTLFFSPFSITIAPVVISSSAPSYFAYSEPVVSTAPGSLFRPPQA